MGSKTSLEVIRNLNPSTEQTRDEIATVEAELMQLEAKQERLEYERRRLEDKLWDLGHIGFHL
ncbi:uncharacterized protein RHO25_009873 [Cercospora beticola]|uniref:Uncharacterized protein n=1 Tax=Cercospora beticola TaxID=122368 RepID=A0ABZ0P0K5_CERBT|nr:hypothetical protein RHO25_009873 [Cercospora beticola]CAK1365011.1 unnamed protein product [Cercospora beticola]